MFKEINFKQIDSGEFHFVLTVIFLVNYGGTLSQDNPIRQKWLSSIMWQIYFQSNLNLFPAGSLVQTLIQGIICSCEYKR